MDAMTFSTTSFQCSRAISRRDLVSSPVLSDTPNMVDPWASGRHSGKRVPAVTTISHQYPRNASLSADFSCTRSATRHCPSPLRSVPCLPNRARTAPGRRHERPHPRTRRHRLLSARGPYGSRWLQAGAWTAYDWACASRRRASAASGKSALKRNAVSSDVIALALLPLSRYACPSR